MDDISGSSANMGESPRVSVTGKILLAAILILFLAVAIVTFLHLYAKWFWGRIEESTYPPPRNRRRRFAFAPGEDPATYDTERRGLEPTVLRSIPVLVFQSEEFKDGLDCAVCLSELVEGEKARLLPKCNHGFHVDCIDMWFQSHSTCPLCRNPVTSESSKSSSSDVHENVPEDMQPPAAENSTSVSPTFPTNVLIWGNQTQVNSLSASSEEEEEVPSSQPPCSSSSASSAPTAGGGINRNQGMLVIDIPNENNSSSLSPSGSRFAEDELKSPMSERLRSLKRLLSWDRRLNPCSPGSVDVEQAGRAQS